MIFRIIVESNQKQLKVITDDPTVRYLLEVTTKTTEYIPLQRKMGTVTRTHRLYNERKAPTSVDGIYTYTLCYGWAAYLIMTFNGRLSVEDRDNILREVIYSPNYRDIPFQGLRDYQNEDVLHILKYRRGLHSCFTGYGKTQVIATIADYAYSIGKSVLLVTPGKKAQDELVKRCKSAFGLSVPSKDGRLDCMITSGLGNRQDYKDPAKRKKLAAWIGTFDWVLADEVEYTINDAGNFIYSSATGATNMYGFSGTSDKNSAESITFSGGLTDVVVRNKDLVKHFGPNLVYRVPEDKDIYDVRIKTTSLDHIVFEREDFDENGNMYQKVMNKIWMDQDVCETIVKVIKRYPLLFIPINNLANILYEWIDNYFVGVFRILLVCGEGYVYYDLKGNRKVLNLTEACDYIKKGKVDVIPSTSSGYRALDLPKLQNILLVEGLKAGVVLQSIGRIARSDTMNIITLCSMSDKKIPVYSKADQARKEMYQTYYKNCKITEQIIYEYQL